MIHFICLDQGKKWYQLKYTDITEHDEFAIISNKIGLQKTPLLLGHLLNRVFLEVRQLGGLRKLKLKHHNRYTKIFLNLMHEIELVKSKGPSMTLTGPICED